MSHPVTVNTYTTLKRGQQPSSLPAASNPQKPETGIDHRKYQQEQLYLVVVDANLGPLGSLGLGATPFNLHGS